MVDKRAYASIDACSNLSLRQVVEQVIGTTLLKAPLFFHEELRLFSHSLPFYSRKITKITRLTPLLQSPSNAFFFLASSFLLDLSEW